MLRHLDLEGGLQDLFRETTKKTARANQIHPLRPDPVHELASELLIKNRPSGKLIHDLSLPARWHPPSLIGLLHRYRQCHAEGVLGVRSTSFSAFVAIIPSAAPRTSKD